LFKALPPHQNTLLEFVDETVGTNVPKQFVPGVERGFRIMAQKGLYANLNYRVLHPVARDLDILCVFGFVCMCIRALG
jgi:hypothetical protein